MVGRTLLGLWARLVCLASVTVLLIICLWILITIDAWRAYETGPELGLEILAKVVFAVWVGFLFGTAATVLALPYVLRRGAAAQLRSENVSRMAAALVLVVCGSAVVTILIRWSVVVGLVTLSNRTSIVLWYFLTGVLIVGIAIWWAVSPRSNSRLEQLADSLSGRATRRFLLIAGVGGLITALSNKALNGVATRPARIARAGATNRNVVLVTFDALTAEDVSCYGYHLPTTPNIDALARSSHVFRNYYSTSTFTTPCVVSMMTGRYPTSSHVYHYGGRLHGAAATRTLPNELRAGGYTTAASVANPGAYPGCLGFGESFDILPALPIRDFATREAASLVRSAQFAAEMGQIAGFGPYMLEQLSPRTLGNTHSTFPPALSFQQAEKLLRRLQGPYFLWVHVLAPHFPYLPEPPYLRKFLVDDELRTHADFANLADLKGYEYSPSKQPDIDKARLRYDEWVAQADGAFGQFMATMQTSGRLENTAVIVSADHGESFQGGFMGHGGTRQFRPIVHVPLIVHLPGQVERQDIATVADQTMLAPTILDVAGIGRPDWMDGRSLLPFVRGETSGRQPLAFTQSLEANSAFGPVTRGTIGVIDGQHQYVLTLETRTAALYNLSESHEQRADRCLAEPALAAEMRHHIAQRFPNVLGA
jgi:arylsulfatase A-like enzyme